MINLMVAGASLRRMSGRGTATGGGACPTYIRGLGWSGGVGLGCGAQYGVVYATHSKLNAYGMCMGSRGAFRKQDFVEVG